MPDLEKLITDRQDQLRGRPRDWIDEFMDWRRGIDWPFVGFVGFVLLLLLIAWVVLQ